VIRTAVIGLGYWGPNLARNFSASEEFQLVGICDTNRDRLAKVASLYPIAAAAAEIDDLLQSPPDIVAIATPVASHYEIACRCIEAGCHVLVEKPLTATVADAQRLLALGERHHRQIFVDHTYVFTGAVEEMKRQLDAGALGELLYVDCVRINLGLFQPDVDVVWDLAPHDVSILNYVLGRLPHTIAAVGSSHNPSGTADVAYLHLDYGDGLTAHLHLSWLSPVKVRRMIVAGTTQSLIFDDLEHDAKIKLYDHGVGFDIGNLENRRQLLVSYRKGDMRAPAVMPSEALSNELTDIARALNNQGKARSSGEHGLAVVRVLEAASRSLANAGRPCVV
jgi:predicted dehydrogenase